MTLLQVFETAQPASPSWSDVDRAWASRLALQDGSADAPTFIARRAQHAMKRLAPREPGAAKWLARRLWHWRWVAWAMLAGVMVGVLADSIGSSQRINLMAPPLWAVLAWNAVVYLLLGHVLARLLMRKMRPGSLVRLKQRALRFGRGLPGAHISSASASASASSGLIPNYAALNEINDLFQVSFNTLIIDSRPCRIHPSAGRDHDGERGVGRRCGDRGNSIAFVRTGTTYSRQARHTITAERA